MSEPFVAEIRMFAGNFAPRGWALCNGQLMAISQNTALFSLLGTYYGGDGKTTFALPNFQGTAPMNQGDGPGLTPRSLGETGGEPGVTLLTTEMPAHAHGANCDGSGVGNAGPGPTTTWSGTLRGLPPAYSSNAANVSMSPLAIGFTGGGQPHNNMSPYLAVTFLIALQGIFPPRG